VEMVTQHAAAPCGVTWADVPMNKPEESITINGKDKTFA